MNTSNFKKCKRCSLSPLNPVGLAGSQSTKAMNKNSPPLMAAEQSSQIKYFREVCTLHRERERERERHGSTVTCSR